jgi:hypothetical protein
MLVCETSTSTKQGCYWWAQNINKHFEALTALSACGLYYKPIMIIKDDSGVINKLETSLIDNARVIIYNCHMFIIQATACSVFAHYQRLLFNVFLLQPLTALTRQTRQARQYELLISIIFLRCLWALLGRVQVNNQVGNGK